MKNSLHKFAQVTGLVALDGAAAAMSIAILLNQPFDISFVILAIILGCITFSSYHINRKAEVEADLISHPERTKIITRNKILDWIAACFLFLAFLLAYLNSKSPLQTIGVLLLMPLTVTLYSISWKQKSSKNKLKFKRLKEITLGKDIITALIWGLITFVVTTYYNLSITIVAISAFIMIFLRVLVSTITFDMRDTKADKSFGVRTLPVIFGPQKTKIILYILNTIFGLFIIFATYLGFLPFYANFLNIITLYGYYFIFKSTGKNIHFFFDVIIDAEPIFWPVLLIIGKIIFRY